MCVHIELWRCVWKVEVTNENGIKIFDSWRALLSFLLFSKVYLFKNHHAVKIIMHYLSDKVLVRVSLFRIFFKRIHTIGICSKISLKFFWSKVTRIVASPPLSSDAANKSMIYDLNQVCVYCVFFSSKFVFCFQVKKEKVLKVPAGYISQFHLSKTLSARVFFTKIWLDITIFKVSTYAEELHILLAVLKRVQIKIRFQSFKFIVDSLSKTFLMEFPLSNYPKYLRF